MNEKTVVSTAQLAAHLGKPVTTIQKWAKEEKIPCLLLPGKEYAFYLEEVIDFLTVSPTQTKRRLCSVCKKTPAVMGDFWCQACLTDFEDPNSSAHPRNWTPGQRREAAERLAEAQKLKLTREQAATLCRFIELSRYSLGRLSQEEFEFLHNNADAVAALPLTYDAGVREGALQNWQRLKKEDCVDPEML